MLEVLEVVFLPSSSDPEIGTLRIDPIHVSLYEAVRGGYYLNSTVREDLKSVATLKKEMVASFQATTSQQGLSSPSANKGFVAESKSRLQHFSTVRFLTSLGQGAEQIIKNLQLPDIYCVTQGASYKSLVRLALSKAKAQWCTEFVRILIKKVARGTNDGDFCSWNECRQATYSLCPSLEGSLRSWSDWEKQDFGTLISPADFKGKDDILVSTMLSEKLISLQAVIKCFCTPGLYDPNRNFLHWNLENPASEKSPLSHWALQLEGISNRWSLDLTGKEAMLQPEKGSSYAQLISRLRDTKFPPLQSLPYKIGWEELNGLFESAVPAVIETGLTINTKSETGALYLFDSVPPIASISPLIVQMTLESYGITAKSENFTEAFCSLLDTLYPDFESKVSASIGDKPLLRVNCSKNAEYIGTLSEGLTNNDKTPLITSYLLAFYICMHTRGKTILDPEYVSSLYTRQGVFTDLTRGGYPPPGASFAGGKKKDKKNNIEVTTYLSFYAPFGSPVPFDASSYQPVVESDSENLDVQMNIGNIQVEDLGDLFKDFEND